MRGDAPQFGQRQRQVRRRSPQRGIGEHRPEREHRPRMEVPFPAGPPYKAHVANLPYTFTEEDLTRRVRRVCIRACVRAAARG